MTTEPYLLSKSTEWCLFPIPACGESGTNGFTGRIQHRESLGLPLLSFCRLSSSASVKDGWPGNSILHDSSAEWFSTKLRKATLVNKENDSEELVGASVNPGRLQSIWIFCNRGQEGLGLLKEGVSFKRCQSRRGKPSEPFSGLLPSSLKVVKFGVRVRHSVNRFGVIFISSSKCSRVCNGSAMKGKFDTTGCEQTPSKRREGHCK
ncbi:hypothetical protein GYMLUDRAFT_599457 [Collybiopsis luxurians FD-317 M1]|uniref:Uncharacterized protein n=1 Tax=Collybiopsis luxurians FD-317 M1 TaxID=944289 RepID=A0A0D0CXL7_9AGAR|nr:hypothetical protein GYMLUDRAFT_599457 [Collybiopsis luxurians FD-317 M1]